MGSRSRRNRKIINNSISQRPAAQAMPHASQINKPAVAQPYENYKYLKNDLMWSGIVAGIIAVILIVVYFFLR